MTLRRQPITRTDDAVNKPLLAFAVLGMAALAALFWLLKPDPSGAPPVTHQPDVRLTAHPAPTAAEAPAKPAVIAIEIRQSRRVAGPEVIRVTQGQEVRLWLTSDQDEELHLHGYDLHVHLHAGSPREWGFIAKHSGRFEFELHGKGHEAISVVEVLPR